VRVRRGGSDFYVAHFYLRLQNHVVDTHHHVPQKNKGVAEQEPAAAAPCEATGAVAGGEEVDWVPFVVSFVFTFTIGVGVGLCFGLKALRPRGS
jgi:hypothetical protein